MPIQAYRAVSLGVDDNEAFIFDHSQRNESSFAIIPAVIDLCKQMTLEYERGFHHIDAAFLEY